MGKSNQSVPLDRTVGQESRYGVTVGYKLAGGNRRENGKHRGGGGGGGGLGKAKKGKKGGEWNGRIPMGTEGRRLT